MTLLGFPSAISLFCAACLLAACGSLAENSETADAGTGGSAWGVGEAAEAGDSGQPSGGTASQQLSGGTASQQLSGGTANQQPSGGTANLGGLDDQCQVASSTALAWTDQTAWGTPAELFSKFAGTCRAPFSWDGSGWSGFVAVEPATGQSTLTATVELDQATARWVTRTAAPDPMGTTLVICQDTLEVEAVVTLELPEGKVAEQRVTLSASQGQTPQTLSLTVPEADVGTWVSIQAVDPSASLSATIEVTPLAQGCSGEIRLSYWGTGQGASGPLASWSDNGCDVGQSAVALDQPFQGVDLAAAVKSAFTEAPFSAVWEGGDATTLDMTLDLPESRACTESLPYGTVVTIPVGIVVTTADGRVRGLSGSGTVRASVADAGLSELQLGLSTDLLCQSSTDALAYASVDCADVQGVTAQLLFNRYFGSPVADGGRLELYVYQRGSSMPGPANWVDRLELGP